MPFDQAVLPPDILEYTLLDCMKTVVNDEVKGDFIETGVWRGGSCIFKYPADTGDVLYQFKIAILRADGDLYESTL